MCFYSNSVDMDRAPHGEAASAATRAWMKRLHIPSSEIPDKIGDMVIDTSLLQNYKGHEYLLKARAKHPAHCRPAWDELRMCIIHRYDRDTCSRIAEAYAPCAKELERAKAIKLLALEDERRKALGAKSRVLEAVRDAPSGAR